MNKLLTIMVSQMMTSRIEVPGWQAVLLERRE